MCHINTVWVVNFLCILIHTSAIQYTHDWAIEVDGGQEEADLVAKDTGCVNQGKNGFFKFLFQCESSDVPGLEKSGSGGSGFSTVGVGLGSGFCLF